MKKLLKELGDNFMEKWLVMSNCQTFGLANCLQAQIHNASVVGVDTLLFKSDPDYHNDRMSEFDKLFIYDGVRGELATAALERIGNHVRIPILTCRAYHPDLIYLIRNGRPLAGPTGDYHSAIAFACYTKGMKVSETQSYFNGPFLEKCGYMSLWAAERDRIINEFRECGLDISHFIRTWGRKCAFMHGINHPRIHAIYDIASAILQSLDRSPQRSDMIPHDNLALGGAFAVYPEIGEALGVPGQYMFRSVGNYKPIGLSEYLEGCFSVYQSSPDEPISPHPQFIDHFKFIESLI